MTTGVTQAHYLKALTSLRRVNRELSHWDGWDAADPLPPGLRPWMEPPTLEREQLKSLQVELIATLGELEERFRRG